MVWSHTLGRTRVKALELAGLSPCSALSSQQGRPQGLQTSTEPSGSDRKRERNPSLKGLHLHLQD